MLSVRQILNDWVLPAATGVLYALALPPFNRGEVGWVALIPLLFAIESCSLAEAFRRGYVAGLVFFGMTIWWVIHVSLPGMLALVGAIALYIAVAAVFLALINQTFATRERDVVWSNLLMALIGAAGWTGLEWVRGKFIMGGFGWNVLGVTQYGTTPLIQFASYTGVYGVSALVFFLNFCLYCTIRRFVHPMGKPTQMRRLSWEFYVAMLLVCGAFVYGMQLIRTGSGSGVRRPLRLALIQGDIPQTLKFDEREKPMILDRYASLTASATVDRVDLVIWPETATPEALRFDRDTFAMATNAAISAQTYLLTGTIDVTPYSDPIEAYNAAILMRPDGSVSDTYKKIHLVPFGEYVPWRKRLPFMKWLTPITDSFERGSEITLFNVHGLNFGTVICFEDTLPDVFRQFVKRGADFMVNLTNDGWFKESPAAAMQMANATFRTVENRRWLIRCTNNGITCVIDEFGVVRKRAPAFEPTTLQYTLAIPENLPVTYYTEHGDVFVAGCGLLSGLFLLVAWRKRRHTIQSQP